MYNLSTLTRCLGFFRMRIQSIAADQMAIPLSIEGLSPYAGGVVAKASITRSNASVLNQSLRREVLAEALLDGFLGDDNADYAGLVAFTRRLRDHSPALAVQLLKPLLRTDATPAAAAETPAVFIFGDVINQATPTIENKSLPPNDGNVLDVE